MIGLVTTSYPRGPEDWAGAFVRERVRRLIEEGAQVEVIAAGQGSVLERGVVRVPGAELFGRAGAPEALEAGGARALVAGAGFTARLAAEVAARAPRWRAVESHWLVPCALVASAVAPRLPHRAVAHGGDVALLERLPVGASLARRLARSGARLVFASADLRARFVRLCGPGWEALAAEVEPAPLDTTLFAAPAPARRSELRRALGCEGRVVLGVGRLVPVKGFDVLVRAVARLPRARRPRVVLLGEGPEGPSLARAAAARRIDVALPGAVDRSTVADWMAAADLYVQPSRALPNGRAEGTPVAVREALAVGVPVIASAVGGLGELTHPNLTLVPADEPELLARAIAAFL
jgi:glycosyltransferase involved in cell wall biosynthesis